jgi:predicted  nucleic acid-binding Zn-ribbon protein
MDMDLLVPALAFVSVFAITAVAAVKITRLRAGRAAVPEVSERLEAVEGAVHTLQQALAETQERLDFAERLLSKAREEKRVGS